MDIEPASPTPTAPAWVSVGFWISVALLVMATLVFLFVSVFILPFIWRWDAAKPIGLLMVYLGLFGLTTLPYFMAPLLYRHMLAGTEPALKPRTFLVIAGLFLIPAILLIPIAMEGPIDLQLFAVPGIASLIFAALLGYQGLKRLRDGH